jgi:hypothetical protein
VRGYTDVETIGLFRTRVRRDGAVEVWVKGWRLESQVPVFIPALLSILFLFAPFPPAVRAIGCGVLIVCAYGTLRVTTLGFRFDARGITVVDVIRTTRVDWPRFAGFVGERNEHEGRCVVLASDGQRVRSPGTLEPDLMDPFWTDDEVAAVDQLNRLASRLRAALTGGSDPTMAIDLTTADAQDVAAGEGAESPGARRLRSMG